MKTNNIQKKTFEDTNVNVKVKIATLWASFMFLYIYVDFFHLYMPNTLESMLAGRVFTFDISMFFLLFAMTFVIIPSLMIYLSVALPAKANRMVNLIAGILFIPYMLFNLVGEAWPHMYLAATVEVLQLCLIIRYAWKWPVQSK